MFHLCIFIGSHLKTCRFIFRWTSLAAFFGTAAAAALFLSHFQTSSYKFILIVTVLQSSYKNHGESFSMELPANYNAFFKDYNLLSKTIVVSYLYHLHRSTKLFLIDRLQISVNVYLCRIPEVIISNTMLPSGRTLFHSLLLFP